MPDLTITPNNGALNDAKAAVGEILGLSEPASNAQVQDHLRQMFRDFVKRYRVRVAQDAAAIAVPDPTVT